MRNLFLILVIIPCFTTAKAQFVNCETMPLVLTSGFSIDTTPSFGDAAIVFEMSNASGTDFAYPQVKFIPLTALPAGMSLNSINSNWAVFASAWNDGDTTTIPVYYDQAMPISPNYTVDFLLYVTNFAPLTIDSCAFMDTITININPTGFAGINNEPGSTFGIYPNPANNVITVQLSAGASETYVDLYTMNGELIRSVYLTKEMKIDISDLSNGMYLVKNREGTYSRKLIILR